MKKTITLCVLIALLISLTACGGAAATTAASAGTASAAATTAPTAAAGTTAIPLDGTWPAQKVKIGFVAFDTTDEQFLAIQKYYTYLSQYFNFEMIYSESIASAEDELKFIENCASAGCKAIIGYYNVSEGQAVQLAIDKGMYYWGGADKSSIYDKFASVEGYLGSYDGGDANYQAGYNIARSLIDAGCQKLVYTSGGRDFGIDFFIDRSDGFYAAVNEAKKTNPKVEVVYDVSGWPGSDAFTADQTKVCDMDIDGIGNSFSALIWIQPLQTAGKFDKVKLATIGNTNEVYKDLMNAGVVKAIVYENEEVQFGGAIPMILNAVNGDNAVNRNNGKAANYKVHAWLLNDPAQINAIYDKHSKNEYFVTPEEVASCIKAFNPDASYQTIADLYSSKTIESIG
jgi:hypothetical protein